jgi:hypothetical protein
MLARRPHPEKIYFNKFVSETEKNSDFAASRIKSDFAIRYKNQVLYFQLHKIYFVKYSLDRTIICAQFLRRNITADRE